MIKEIAYTCYPVNNLKKARAFYEGILELKPTKTWIGEDMGFIEYDIGAGTFAIGNGSDNIKQSSEGACIAFEVDDFDAVVKKLKDNKVVFSVEPNETPVCHMAVIEDPDGSKIMIHKRK